MSVVPEFDFHDIPGLHQLNELLRQVWAVGYEQGRQDLKHRPESSAPSLRVIKDIIAVLVLRAGQPVNGFQVPVGTFSRVCHEEGMLAEIPEHDGSVAMDRIWRAELTRLFHGRRFTISGRRWLVSCRHGKNFWFLPRGRN